MGESQEAKDIHFGGYCFQRQRTMCIIPLAEQDVRLGIYFVCVFGFLYHTSDLTTHTHAHSPAHTLKPYFSTYKLAHGKIQAHIRPRSFVIAEKLIAYITSCTQMIWNLCKVAWWTRLESQREKWDKNTANKGEQPTLAILSTNILHTYNYIIWNE